MIAFLMGLPTISPAELAAAIESGDVTVYDVNSPSSFRSARVPGARPLDPEAFDASHLPAERSARLVFYCSNPLCRKAPNAARRAKRLGWENVRVMSAGIQGWVGRGLPTEKGAAVPASADPVAATDLRSHRAPEVP